MAPSTILFLRLLTGATATVSVAIPKGGSILSMRRGKKGRPRGRGRGR